MSNTFWCKQHGPRMNNNFVQGVPKNDFLDPPYVNLGGVEPKNSPQ